MDLTGEERIQVSNVLGHALFKALTGERQIQVSHVLGHALFKALTGEEKPTNALFLKRPQTHQGFSSLTIYTSRTGGTSEQRTRPRPI